jgi:hypothetical protein
MLDKQQSGIEEELRRWQAQRARKEADADLGGGSRRDRRTVRINGREVEIVKKPRRAGS